MPAPRATAIAALAASIALGLARAPTGPLSARDLPNSGQMRAQGRNDAGSFPGMASHNTTNLAKAATAAVVTSIAVGPQASAGISPPSSGFARFSRDSDTIQVLGNTTFNQGDFTYEMHIRFDASGQAGPIDPNSPFGSVISEQHTGDEDKTIQFSSDGYYVVSASTSGPSGNSSGRVSPFPTGQWVHLAFVRHGNTSTIYIDGVAAASHLTTWGYIDSPGSWMSIGMFRQGAGYSPTPARPSFIGDLDWIRVSSGAVYTSNFAPPTEGDIGADPSTQLLFKFNESAGTTTIYDESANHFQGNLGVPVSPGVTATTPTLMTGTVPGPGALPLAAIAAMARRRRR